MSTPVLATNPPVPMKSPANGAPFGVRSGRGGSPTTVGVAVGDVVTA